MKTKQNSKYFIMAWAIVFVMYNVILFLVVGKNHQELFKEATFWILYAWMMIAFIAVRVVAIVEKADAHGGLRPLLAGIYGYLIVTFVATTALFFVSAKLNFIWAILIFVVITCLAAIFMCFGGLHNNMLMQNQPRVKEIYKIEELSGYFTNVANSSSARFQGILNHLASLTATLTTVEGNDEVAAIDKRLIERAAFIKGNAERSENNIDHNAEKFEELLKERESVVARINGNASN